MTDKVFVKATKRGYIRRVIEPGEIFEVAADKVSKNWMEIVDPTEATPEETPAEDVPPEDPPSGGEKADTEDPAADETKKNAGAKPPKDEKKAKNTKPTG